MLEIKDLHATINGKEILKWNQSDCKVWRGTRYHGTEWFW